MRINKKFLNKTRIGVLSDLLVNLSAGWFGLILIIPGLGGVKSPQDAIFLLTTNLFWGIIALVLAMKLREDSK
jgi:hypothetical protein